MTLIRDCEQQVTKPLNRQGLRLSSSGIILIGQQLLDESYYSGDLQQLMLVPSPESAYEVCKQFMPECSKPLSESVGLGSASSAIKRQLPLSVTGQRGGASSTSNATDDSNSLVYAQAPPGSFVV